MNKNLPIALLSLLAAAPFSGATLLVYDGFNVTGSGNLTTVNNTSDVGSTGFAGGYNWNGSTGAGVLLGAGLSAGGFGSGQGAVSDASNYGAYSRTFSSDVTSAWNDVIVANGDIWVSLFISQNSAVTSTADGTGLVLLSGGSGINNLAIGAGGYNQNMWGYGDGSAYGSGANSGVVRGPAVTKLTLNFHYNAGGTTTVKGYINGTDDALGTLFYTNPGVATNLIFSGLQIKSSAANAFTVDEIRIGTALTDVVSAVPEPSAYGLLGACAMASFALVRRRRRS